MKRLPLWLMAVSLLILAGFLWWWLASDSYPIRNFPSAKSGPILVFGDSLAEGVGGAPDHDLATLLGQSLHEPVLNYGVAGDTTALALARLASPVDESPKLVIVILGGNDFIKRVPRQETFSNLKTIITAFQDQGAIVIVAGVRSGLIGGGADDAFASLAKETGAAYLEDILGGVFGRNEFMSDAVHPNAAGYTKIAERFVPLVEKLIKNP